MNTMSIRKMSGGIINRKIILVAVTAACTAWLFAQLSFHFGSTAPAQQAVLTEKAKSLAKEVDAALKLRTAVITATVYNRSLEKLLSASGFESLANFLRSQFPDFLSLEVLNANGEVIAMIGDLLLNPADLSPKDAGENVFKHDPKAYVTGVFRDDLPNNCFFVTCRHKGEDGTYWFSRTRFTRNSLEGILGESHNRAALVSISGGKQDLQVISGHPSRAYGTWWSGPQYVETTLESPGWILKAGAEGRRSLLGRASVIIPALGLILGTLGLFVGRRIPSAVHQGKEVVETADSVHAPASKFEPNATPQLHDEFDLIGLPKQSELFPIGSGMQSKQPDYEPKIRTDEAEDEYFCPPQLVFDPIVDEFALDKEKASSDESPVSQHDEFPPDSFENGPEPVHEEIMELIPENDLPEELEVSWEENSEPVRFDLPDDNADSAAQTLFASDQARIGSVPDVIELVWEEPKSKSIDSEGSKKQKQRESVLFSEFFNC